MVSRVVGQVVAKDGGSYRVAMPEGEIAAVLRGRLKQSGTGRWDREERVVVGDRVQLEPPAGGTAAEAPLWGIAGIEPRKNVLTRREASGRGERAIAANIDHAYIVMATANPAPLAELLDRLLVLAAANEIPAAVVLNKQDIEKAESFRRRAEQAGYPVFPVSARTGEGVERWRDEMSGGVSLVTGPSGAGKTSLLNLIVPGAALATRSVSQGDRRGRNTTVAARMVPLPGGGFLVDTPGFSEAGLWGIEPRELARCFPDFEQWIEHCRFADCRHQAEPGCTLRQAVEAGEVDATRYESYGMLLAELTSGPAEWE